MLDARVMLAEIYQWSMDIDARGVFKWIRNILKEDRFWNYFEHRFLSGVIEGINRAIKGLRWRPQFQLILHPHKFQKERENRQPDSRCL